MPAPRDLVDQTGAWRVRAVQVIRGGHTVDVLRVTHHGYLVADCRDVAEVGQHVDLSALRPARDYSAPAEPEGNDPECE